MRGFGMLVGVVGVLALIGAMMMDVSVSSGLGRVNNIGLMAERQNYIIIGCVMLIAGLLMTMLGRRQAAPALDIADSRACPVCAETIKNAAIKCKHCGAEVSSGVELSPSVRTSTVDLVKDMAQAWKARGILYVMILVFIIVCAVSSNS